MKKDVLNLGNRLAEELGDEPRGNTLSRWMAHYIAQQMNDIETKTGKDRVIAEEKCFDTIMKLWEHRTYLPDGHRPFENFESIFKTLERLDPDYKKPFYFEDRYTVKQKKFNKKLSDDVDKFLEMATGIDEVARVWIKFVFQQAASVAVDEKTKKWIEAAAPLADKDEASLVIKFITNNDFDEKKVKEEQIGLLKKRIAQLEYFRQFSEELISMYKDELSHVTEEI